MSELPITYCGKTIEEWHESAARNALKLYRLRRDIEDCIRDVNSGTLHGGVSAGSYISLLDKIEHRLLAALVRSGGGND